MWLTYATARVVHPCTLRVRATKSVIAAVDLLQKR
jgi:hypothetical protein